MSSVERIGVFGGTFDPIHCAHLEIARTAVREAALDRVLFVVSACPPHKRMRSPIAKVEDRYAMVRAAVKDELKMEASCLEIDRPGPSYTVETLETLRALHPDAQLFLILGMDSLVDLPHWKHPQRILELARLLVVRRPGTWNIPESVKGHFELLSLRETTLSSTEVRRRVSAGEDVREMLPAAVEQLIREKNIYEVGPVLPAH
ncbi:MAG: nicotinate-nucleotide adenylyltransferase [Candidatus Hydrogenedentes bacterium]|nr:nicotinate-nucleotide adenylyltransferase [Candidatus Hydrogenedentota bacterium]